MGGEVRFILLLCAFFISLAAHANPTYPVPKYLPPASYPTHMVKTRQPGQIVVRAFIHADGRVSIKEVVSSPHKSLDRAIMKVLPQWRFEPWTPPADHPEGETVTFTFRFNVDGTQQGPINLNVILKKLYCSEVNEELRWNSISHESTAQRYESRAFYKTRLFLSKNSVLREFLSDAQRRTLIDELDRAIPDIIKKCKAHPGAKYVDFLPEQVRNVL